MVKNTPGAGQSGPRPASPWAVIAQGVTIRSLSALLVDGIRKAFEDGGVVHPVNTERPPASS